MNRNEILLTILAEECVETAQRASKALRFTLQEIQPGQDQTNAQRIVYEFNDIVAVMEILQAEGIVDKVVDREAIEKKKLKIAEYLIYSHKTGALTLSTQERIKEIAESYHERNVTASMTGPDSECPCCKNIVSSVTCLEHDSMDFSKDLMVCTTCYINIVTYWQKEKPGKVRPN